MDLLPDDEQAEIAAAARKLLTGELEWRTCADQGWFAIGLPVELGGIGYGAAEETLLFREIGRALAPGPYLGTVLAAHLAARAASAAHAARSDLVAGFAAGELRAGLATPADATATIGARVSGSFLTFDGADVDYFLVLDGIDGSTAALVPAAEASIQPLSCIDPAARRAVFAIDAASAAWTPADDFACWRHAAVLTAAMLSGIAEAARDDSVAYAGMREQFGSPIGAFQAVKHRCADAATRADAAVHLTSLAALSYAAGTADCGQVVVAALHVAADAALRNAADDVQNHGGIGFTAEANAHRYLKRAHVLAQSLGPPADRRRALLG